MHKIRNLLVVKAFVPLTAVVAVALGGCYNHFRYQPQASFGDTAAAVRCAAACGDRRGELGRDAYLRCLQLCPLERSSGRCSPGGEESGMCVQHSELNAGKTVGLIAGIVAATSLVIFGVSTLRDFWRCTTGCRQSGLR